MPKETSTKLQRTFYIGKRPGCNRAAFGANVLREKHAVTLPPAVSESAGMVQPPEPTAVPWPYAATSKEIKQRVSSLRQADLGRSDQRGVAFAGWRMLQAGCVSLLQVEEARVLAVGAGGIGCELLKTLVMSGFKHIEVVRPCLPCNGRTLLCCICTANAMNTPST